MPGASDGLLTKIYTTRPTFTERTPFLELSFLHMESRVKNCLLGAHPQICGTGAVLGTSRTTWDLGLDQKESFNNTKRSLSHPAHGACRSSRSKAHDFDLSFVLSHSFSLSRLVRYRVQRTTNNTSSHCHVLTVTNRRRKSVHSNTTTVASVGWTSQPYNR